VKHPGCLVFKQDLRISPVSPSWTENSSSHSTLVTTIIALLDFSTVTDQVFETAAGLADALHGRVVLLHVVQPSRVPAAGITVLETMQAAVNADQQVAARRLARYERRLRLDKIAVTTVLLRGVPAPLILEQAGKLRAAFLVMGSHGHGTITGRLVGTTTEYLLRRARCPVIVVSHPKFKEVAGGAG
jgi:nucleotide-binding universal stress UspA family protein